MALVQTGPLVAEAQNGRYDLPNGDRIEALGVCAIEEKNVRCWDRSGGPLPELAEEIGTFYERVDYQELQFFPGKKNRYFVYRRKTAKEPELRLEGAAYLPTAFYWEEVNQTIYWGRVTPEKGAATFDIRMMLPEFRELPATEAPFAAGQTLKVEGYRFVLGKIAPAPTFTFPSNGFGGFGGPSGKSSEPPPPVPKRWRVALPEQPPEDAPLRFRFEFLDKKGKPIQYVSDKGLPISQEEFYASLDHRQHVLRLPPPGGSTMRGYGVASFLSDGRDTGSFSTNVDPAIIGKFRVVPIQPLHLWFRDLPVDPRS